jgi:regulator of nucleoside diphosphate kinase
MAREPGGDEYMDITTNRDHERLESFVTMGSTVAIRDSKKGESFTYTLVFPAEADIRRDRISVMSPLGAALLGRKEGESFSYESPGGLMRVRLERVTHGS